MNVQFAFLCGFNIRHTKHTHPLQCRAVNHGRPHGPGSPTFCPDFVRLPTIMEPSMFTQWHQSWNHSQVSPIIAAPWSKACTAPPIPLYRRGQCSHLWIDLRIDLVLYTGQSVILACFNTKGARINNKNQGRGKLNLWWRKCVSGKTSALHAGGGISSSHIHPLLAASSQLIHKHQPIKYPILPWL